MRRRTLLTTTVTAITASITGCLSSLTTSGANQDDCRESPTAIETLDDDSHNEVTIIGTVTNIDEDASSFTVSGDTGEIVVGGPPYPDEDACVRVTGRVSTCVGDGCEDTYYLDPASWEST